MSAAATTLTRQTHRSAPHYEAWSGWGRAFGGDKPLNIFLCHVAQYEWTTLYRILVAENRECVFEYSRLLSCWVRAAVKIHVDLSDIFCSDADVCKCGFWRGVVENFLELVKCVGIVRMGFHVLVAEGLAK